MFGFRVDGVPRQLNYLFDEGQSIGEDGKLSHGPNAVISMVHDGLSVAGFGEDSCSLHADNCAGKVLLYSQYIPTDLSKISRTYNSVLEISRNPIIPEIRYSESDHSGNMFYTTLNRFHICTVTYFFVT